VARYASILEEAHVVRLVRPWASGKRAETTASPKVFFYDNGIRNAVLTRFQHMERRDDAGALWENWTYSEVCKRVSPLLDTVGYWRTRSGAEVDFVVETGGRRIGIEVKASASGRTLLNRSARSFIDAARPAVFVTLYRGLRVEREFKGCRVLWTHPTELGQLLETDRP
jgi:predicted AAA+ superfamily ATPase